MPRLRPLGWELTTFLAVVAAIAAGALLDFPPLVYAGAVTAAVLPPVLLVSVAARILSRVLTRLAPAPAGPAERREPLDHG